MQIPNSMKRLIRGNQPVLDELFDVLHKYQVPSEEGERLLAYIIGVSKGYRQMPLTDPELAIALASGWAAAAEHGDD